MYIFWHSEHDNRGKKKMVKNEPVSINPIREKAIRNRENLVTESEAEKDDMTPYFMPCVYRDIEKGSLSVMAVRGRVTRGKSTVAIAVMYKENKFLYKIGRRKTIPDIFECIQADQTEFLRWISKKEENICTVTDEFNIMAETGLNSSTEQALYQHYSTLFAQRFNHRVTCNPSLIIDPNTEYVLDVIEPIMERKVTRCRLSYRDVVGGWIQCVGFVDIDVSEVMQQEGYRRYRIKKFKRMELLEKHGIRDIRDLEFAPLVIQIVKELKELAIADKVSQNLLTSETEAIVRLNKRVYSLLTQASISSRAKSILELITEEYRIQRKLQQPKTPQKELLSKALQKIVEMKQKRIQQERDLEDLNNEYQQIQG